MTVFVGSLSPRERVAEGRVRDLHVYQEAYMKYRIHKLISFALLSLFLASCRVVGPNYTKPIVPAPEAFLGAGTPFRLIPGGDLGDLAVYGRGSR